MKLVCKKCQQKTEHTTVDESVNTAYILMATCHTCKQREVVEHINYEEQREVQAEERWIRENLQGRE